MRRCVASTVASRRTVRRSATNAPVREGFGRSYVAPKSHYTRRRCERDDDDDDEYLRPNKVVIHNQNRGHSDRNHSRKISKFKSSYRGSNKVHKNWQGKAHLVREQLNSEFSHRNRQPFKNRSFPKKNYRNGNGNFRNSSWVLKESYSGLYEIHVQNLDDCDEVLNLIQNYIAPVQLHPYNIHFLDDKSKLVFVVDDFKTAKILQNVNGRIKLHDKRLGIRVNHYYHRVPNVSVSSEVREKMAQEIANRHNPHTKCLDLSHFHSCQLFTQNKLFLPLNHPLFLMAALKMGAEYVKHDLYGLSLKKNHIYLSEGFIWIRRLFPDLKVLDLGENKLTEMRALKSLSGFTIKELNLSKNPVNQTENEKEVLNIFPVLKKLNDSELQSRYSVIVDLKLKMPIYLDNSYPIPEGHDLKNPNPVAKFVEMFLTQFFERYDNKLSRQQVGEAYQENSMFTLSSKKLLHFCHGNLSYYKQESRNLLIPFRNNIGNSLLHRGRENILNFLEKLPKTKHDLGSFQIDVPLANAQMIQIVVNGVFAENFEENDPKYLFRSFCRTFCLIPDGSNWRILSDMLFVTVVSNEITMESVKRFNALKPLNKINFNCNKTNKIMFMEDADEMYHFKSLSSNHLPGVVNCPPSSYQEAMFSNSIHSQRPSFYQSSSSLLNQQLTTQHHITSSAAMTFQWKQQESNAMSSQILNMTRPPPLKTCPSPIILSSPSSPTNDSQPETMTIQWKQQEPSAMSGPVSNMTQPPPLKTCSSPIILSSPSSPTYETQSVAVPFQCKQLEPKSMSSPVSNKSSLINTNLNKLKMIKKFSNETGMNVRWTEKCLKENGWDYKKASLSYSSLKSKIPSVAYIH